MQKINTQINHLAATYIRDLQNLIHGAAMASITAVLKPSGKHSSPHVKRRTLDELEEYTEKLLAAIRSRPGTSMREVAEMLGCSCSDLGTPVRRLIIAGSIKKAGERQFTKYFPMGSASKTRRRRES